MMIVIIESTPTIKIDLIKWGAEIPQPINSQEQKQVLQGLKKIGIELTGSKII